jgi:hypothetical protein
MIQNVTWATKSVKVEGVNCSCIETCKCLARGASICMMNKIVMPILVALNSTSQKIVEITWETYDFHEEVMFDHQV